MGRRLRRPRRGRRDDRPNRSPRRRHHAQRLQLPAQKQRHRHSSLGTTREHGRIVTHNSGLLFDRHSWPTFQPSLTDPHYWDYRSLESVLLEAAAIGLSAGFIGRFLLVLSRKVTASSSLFRRCGTSEWIGHGCLLLSFVCRSWRCVGVGPKDDAHQEAHECEPSQDEKSESNVWAQLVMNLGHEERKEPAQECSSRN